MKAAAASGFNGLEKNILDQGTVAPWVELIV